jgi:hypothetical protein
VPNPFDVPLWTTFAWKGTNGWTVTPQRESYLLEPGTPLTIPIKARGPAAEFYPVPTATLRFQTPEGEKAFRNDVVEFYPLKVRSDLTLRVPTVASPPEIDGAPDEVVWNRAQRAGSFVVAQGDSQPTRGVEAHLIHRG